MGKDDNGGKGSFRRKSTVNRRGVQTFGKISAIEAVNSGNNSKETICSWQSARSKYMLCISQSLGRVNICGLKVLKKTRNGGQKGRDEDLFLTQVDVVSTQKKV
jgi:hypothetical protein